MNRRLYLRLTLHIAVVGAALGLGMGVRAMLPHRTFTAGAPTTPPDKSTAPPAEVPPLFPAAAGRPVAGYSPAEQDALRSRVRDLSRCSNPIQEQFLLRTTLLNGINSVEDFQRALELLEGSGGEIYFCQDLIRDLAARLAEKDPAAAVGALTLIKDRHARHLAADKVIKNWAQHDPDGALDYVSTQSTGVKASGLNAIFHELAQRDPAAAMARIKDYNNPDFHYGLECTVLSQWWIKDQAAALAWVNTQPAPQRKDLMRSVVSVVSREDPAGAWKLIQSIPAGERPDTFAMSNLLNSWAHKDPDAALTAALGESDATRRNAILEQFGRTMKLVDEGADGAARGPAMLATITDEAQRQQFLYGLAQGYLYDGRERDYRQVLNLTNQLTDGKQHLAMIKSIAGSWAKTDAPAASEWLDTLPAGPGRDGAIGEFVRGTFATDPAAAMTWSASIADEGKRGRRLAELYPKWLKTDAGAAAAWLSQQTQLSPADRAAMEAATTVP